LKITTDNDIELNTWIYLSNAVKDKKTVLIMAYPDAGNIKTAINIFYYLKP